MFCVVFCLQRALSWCGCAGCGASWWAAEGGEEDGGGVGVGAAVEDLAVVDDEPVADREVDGFAAERGCAVGFDEHDVAVNSGSLGVGAEVGEQGEQAAEHPLNVTRSACACEHGLGERRLIVDERAEVVQEGAGLGQRPAFGEHPPGSPRASSSGVRGEEAGQYGGEGVGLVAGDEGCGVVDQLEVAVGECC